MAQLFHTRAALSSTKARRGLALVAARELPIWRDEAARRRIQAPF